MPASRWLPLPRGKKAKKASQSSRADEEQGLRQGQASPPRFGGRSAAEVNEVTYLARDKGNLARGGRAGSGASPARSPRLSELEAKDARGSTPSATESQVSGSTTVASRESTLRRAEAVEQRDGPRSLAKRAGAAAAVGKAWAGKPWCCCFVIAGASFVALFAASMSAGVAAAVLLQTSTTTTTTTFSGTHTTITGTTTSTSRTSTSTTGTGTTSTRTSSSTTSSTTTSTTSTTTSATVTITKTGASVLPSLYCFSASNSTGNELELLRIQLAQGVGIFDCNGWTVFTAEKAWLDPGRYATVPVPGPTSKLGPVPGHPDWQMLLNVGMFMRIWEKLLEKGDFKWHQWTVKVDPDAVFFPARLRFFLRTHSMSSKSSVYLLNCQTFSSIQGPLEVLSLTAASAFAKGRGRCLRELSWRKMGEDMFLQHCLSLLGISGVAGFQLLVDAKCGQPAVCTGDVAAAYHPFKSVGDQYACRQQLGTHKRTKARMLIE
mmetsp:Transcript_101856/g.288337  ORF Transcript_101856/g.288337 Transcript_101856/m.288337 type:complete len:491 (-) Transcript_101856:21-1493(-)